MEVLEDGGDDAGVEARGVVFEAAGLAEVCEELAAHDVLHHNVQIPRVVEHPVHVHLVDTHNTVGGREGGRDGRRLPRFGVGMVLGVLSTYDEWVVECCEDALLAVDVVDLLLADDGRLL